MAEHNLDVYPKYCPACRDHSSITTHLFAQVARLEGKKAALAAALRDAEWSYPGTSGNGNYSFCPCCFEEEPGPHEEGCKLHAALSDTGEGWLPPEVREQARRAILYLAGIIHRQRHAGQFFTRCETVPCLEARSALGALGGK